VRRSFTDPGRDTSDRDLQFHQNEETMSNIICARSVFMVVFAISLFANLAEVNAALADEKGADGNEKLSGSRVTIQDAIEQSDSIVIARLSELGVASYDFPGKTSFPDCVMEINRTLKGKQKGVMVLNIDVIDGPKYLESIPKNGKEYIVFIKISNLTNPSHIKLIKMLNSSDEHIKIIINKVKK
jgi:hypothetical protein